jgi:hypothetical protein
MVESETSNSTTPATTRASHKAACSTQESLEPAAKM